jgi:putative nucleotidyltransferase with HDIG domain
MPQAKPVHRRPAVLFVDDEPMVLKTLTRLFRSEPIDVLTAGSAKEAMSLLDEQYIQVVVSDQQMPGITGASLLANVRELYPDVIRIMLTGYTEMNIAVEAINEGEVYRLMTKPWNDEEMLATISQAFDTHEMRGEIERLNRITKKQNRVLEEMNRSLEQKVQERTRQVQEKHAELRTAYVSTVRTLAEAVDAKDPYTRGHSERVGIYASRIARELGCKSQFIERIYLAGLLHDIGKIGIPDAIITKPGRLTAEEYDTMKRHPEIGARILEPVVFLADVVPCVRHHHEWYDGSDSGYPDKLNGVKIPFPSRIILVADTVEAMTSDRPYRKAVPLEEVILEIQRFSGTQFDPDCADAFLELIEREGEDFIEHASKFNIENFLREF